MSTHERSLSRADRPRPGLASEVLPYAAIGGLQLVVDWCLFVLLSWLGLLVPVANIIGRIAGALLGFWFNGRYTFARSHRSVLRRSHFFKFCVSWSIVTALSTIAVTALSQGQWLWLAWLAKPIIDGLLAAIGFFASKYWIYR